MRKNLDPNILPEKQHVNSIKGSIENPHIGQGRAGLRRRRLAPINQTIIPPSDLSQKIPGETKIETRQTNHANSSDPMHSVNNADERMTHTRPLIPDVPFHPGPTYRPPPKLIRSNMPRSQESSQSSDSSGNSNINSDINLDFEENSPFTKVLFQKLITGQTDLWYPIFLPEVICLSVIINVQGSFFGILKSHILLVLT